MSNKRVLLVLLSIVACAAVLAVVQDAPRADARGKGHGPPVTIMSRNVYLGADVAPIFAAAQAGGFEDVVAATTRAYAQALASDMPARAAAIADEIASARPHLVGLQEAVVWTALADPTDPVSTDFLQQLVAELADRGQQYEAVAVAPGFDMALPTAYGYPVKLTMSDVLLARADLPADRFSVTNPQTGNYAARIRIPLETPEGTQVVEIPRQWASADVTRHGQSFRLITTHLESAVEDIRVFQAGELLDIANSSELPLVLVGDLNSEADDAGDASWLLTRYGGFDDAWTDKPRKQDGNTCCQDPSLRNVESTLVKRIDFVMTRGGFHTIGSRVVGDEWISDPTAAGDPVLWASDHAGVTTTMLLPRHRD